MRRLTLSFDNGPCSDTTPTVLDELAARNLRAYFFVVGRQILRPGGRQIVKAAAAAGHIIGNHSMNHSEPLGTSEDPDHVAEEIEATERLLIDAGVASKPPLFRPFGRGGQIGHHLLSALAAQHLISNKYSLVLWNSVPRDWIHHRDWPDRAIQDIKSHRHTVMVLHDLPTSAMIELPRFLDYVADNDVEVTLELPEDCLPIQEGVASGSLAACVAPS